jgi:hypothetical protein
MVPERHNTIKVLMLLDVGGTMDDHIKRTEELFSAAKTEFKHLEFYYFHNCVYDFVWKNNRRRHAERLMTWDLLRKYNPDYRLIFVGDATMSPYEILQPGGSVEYNNEEPGASGCSGSPSASRSSRGSTPSPKASGSTASRSKTTLAQFLRRRRPTAATSVATASVQNSMKKKYGCSRSKRATVGICCNEAGGIDGERSPAKKNAKTNACRSEIDVAMPAPTMKSQARTVTNVERLV